MKALISAALIGVTCVAGNEADISHNHKLNWKSDRWVESPLLQASAKPDN